ncbi:hypothetical protein DID77_01105 [Candidatus Marinamargulisbacteria bacterium SCGC AG-439-L15]|nr:hypothetical protein DID77_01105 [Candidatus Marinamargulisbacteria bacterium SCGC AG-439-L15]
MSSINPENRLPAIYTRNQTTSLPQQLQQSLLPIMVLILYLANQVSADNPLDLALTEGLANVSSVPNPTAGSLNSALTPLQDTVSQLCEGTLSSVMTLRCNIATQFIQTLQGSLNELQVDSDSTVAAMKSTITNAIYVIFNYLTAAISSGMLNPAEVPNGCSSANANLAQNWATNLTATGQSMITSGTTLDSGSRCIVRGSSSGPTTQICTAMGDAGQALIVLAGSVPEDLQSALNGVSVTLATVCATARSTLIAIAQSIIAASTNPSTSPSFSPSTSPSFSPSTSPSFSPSTSPSLSPSTSPSFSPSTSPSFSPSTSPSAFSTIQQLFSSPSPETAPPSQGSTTISTITSTISAVVSTIAPEAPSAVNPSLNNTLTGEDEDFPLWGTLLSVGGAIIVFLLCYYRYQKYRQAQVLEPSDTAVVNNPVYDDGAIQIVPGQVNPVVADESHTDPLPTKKEVYLDTRKLHYKTPVGASTYQLIPSDVLQLSKNAQNQLILILPTQGPSTEVLLPQNPDALLKDIRQQGCYIIPEGQQAPFVDARNWKFIHVTPYGLEQYQLYQELHFTYDPSTKTLVERQSGKIFDTIPPEIVDTLKGARLQVDNDELDAPPPSKRHSTPGRSKEVLYGNADYEPADWVLNTTREEQQALKQKGIKLELSGYTLSELIFDELVEGVPYDTSAVFNKDLYEIKQTTQHPLKHVTSLLVSKLYRYQNIFPTEAGQAPLLEQLFKAREKGSLLSVFDKVTRQEDITSDDEIALYQELTRLNTALAPTMGKNLSDLSREEKLPHNQLDQLFKADPTFSLAAIHASEFVSPITKRPYILAQGPKPQGISAHLELLFMADSCAMLTGLTEKRKMKCADYRPATVVGEVVSFDVGDNETIELTTLSHDAQSYEKTDPESEKQNFWRIERVEMTQKKEGVVVGKHYIAFGDYGEMWPDHGVPTNLDSLLEFRAKLNEVEETCANANRDIHSPSHYKQVIHCSAGVGRTGTYCAIDQLLAGLFEGKSTLPEKDIPALYNLVNEMRKARSSMVQTPEQYGLVADVVQKVHEAGLEDDC